MGDDARLTRHQEVAAILRCLHESLREPDFASTLVRLVSGNGLSEKREIADRSRLEASAENSKG